MAESDFQGLTLSTTADRTDVSLPSNPSIEKWFEIDEVTFLTPAVHLLAALYDEFENSVE